jgi:hypothetical protein
VAFEEDIKAITYARFEKNSTQRFKKGYQKVWGISVEDIQEYSVRYMSGKIVKIILSVKAGSAIF